LTKCSFVTILHVSALWRRDGFTGVDAQSVSGRV
jgi:hypothetical protein